MSYQEEQSRELIDAANKMISYAWEHLPDGWSITLEVLGMDAIIALYDPSGEEVDIGDADSDCSTILAMCEFAQEREDETNGIA